MKVQTLSVVLVHMTIVNDSSMCVNCIGEALRPNLHIAVTLFIQLSYCLSTTSRDIHFSQIFWQRLGPGKKLISCDFLSDFIGTDLRRAKTVSS